MKIATVRDFKAHATRYLHSREDVYVTRHGKKGHFSDGAVGGGEGGQYLGVVH